MAKIIEGLKLYKPKVIKDKRGSVLHMIKNSEILRNWRNIFFYFKSKNEKRLEFT